MWLMRKAMAASMVVVQCATAWRLRSGYGCTPSVTSSRSWPGFPSLDLLDLDHEIPVRQLAHRQSHAIAAPETRGVQHLLGLGKEGHISHLVHEPGRSVVVHHHQRLAGPPLEHSGDSMEARTRIDGA